MRACHQAGRNRARLIDRFLDWMVDRGALANNPFATLRREYGQRTTKPIVQALLDPGFEVALEALREAVRMRAASVDEIMRAAEVCRARTIMRSYLEALSP